MNTPNQYIGKPLNRVDGVAKVTGTAKYAAEFHLPHMAYGVVVNSNIAKGRIKNLDTLEALKQDGVIEVFSHLNTPKLARLNFSYMDMDAPPGKHFRYFQTDKIYYNQQPVALVVADTFEQARHAATLIQVEYELEEHITDLLANTHLARKPKGKKLGFKKPLKKGHFEKAFSQSGEQLEASYYHGAEHHNPMEMFASTVEYKSGGKLVVYDKTQGVFNSLKYVCGVFSLAYKNVDVKSPFVGGAFGSGLRPQYQLFMATLAALQLKRSVQVSLTRQQMFSFGHRPATQQQLALGASPNGMLQAIKHTAITETSQFEDYAETVVNWSSKLYECGNVQQDHKLVPLDVYTPLDMRAPGGVTGVYALECAIDEMAYQLKIDPLEFRLKNYAEKDGETGKPYSSKALKQCFAQGAEKFGWHKRPLEASIQKEGNLLIGQGMASGVWDAMLIPGRAKATLTADGKLQVGSGTADIGTGTYTIMTQIAAETLGLPLEDVTFKLGDTSLPLAFIEGGSATAASIGTAVLQACLKVKSKLLSLAKEITIDSPFGDAGSEDVLCENGELVLKSSPASRISFTEILRNTRTKQVEKTATALPNILKQMPYAQNTHAAHFAEVAVDAELGTITVRKVVSAIAAGRILNPKTARSQILGGIVWGISMALQEHSVMDHHSGKFINHNLAEYHVPVNADIKNLEVIFVKEDDAIVNPLGVKGVGEIGMVGVAAAVANAVFHATGKRVRNLPITLDKIL
jgi:xanthine dehydrogenase YagR molybdenum-binding subunit